MPTNTSTLAAQARTIEDAVRSGLEWTHADIARLEAYQGRDEDLAHELGRTLFAITSMRQAIKEGRAQREGRDAQRQARRVLPYDLGFVGSIPDEW